MTSKKILLSVSVLVATLLASCNLYSPLEGGGSIQDHLEVAQDCLTRSDYDCAAAEYMALPDGSQKSQKLCTLYLSQGGFTLSSLVTVFNLPDKKKSLGAVANKSLPYSASRQAGADAAKIHCAAYKTAVAAGATEERQLGELLSSLAYFNHCAVLMAKTTSLQTVDDVACTTASTSATVTAASISASGNGSVSAGNPGMCKDDAVACLADISGLAGSSIGGQLQYIKDAYTQIQAQFPGSGATVARAGLISTL